jgi:hypothetical protein
MRGSLVGGVVLGGVMVFTGCVIVPCDGDTCGGGLPAFDVVHITTGDNVMVRTGPAAQVLQDCGDGVTRILDAQVSQGAVFVDTSLRARMDGPRCVLTVEAPRLANLTHEGLGDVDVEAGMELDAVHNLGSGTIRARGVTGRAVDILNDSLGMVRVDRLDAANVTVTQRGSGDIRVDAVRGEVLDAFNTGLGSLSLGNLNVLTVALGNTGSGVVTAAGGADSVALALEGLGDIHAGGLGARVAHVNHAGSGDAHAFARDRLDIQLDSLGDVYAYGHPAQVVVRGNGTGDVFLVE